MADAGEDSGRKSRRIIAISGGGIAGLTAALTLADAGFGVTVFEKNAEPSTAGAGIQISPNAHNVLNRLGLGRALRTAATAPNTIEIKSGVTGAHLSEFELGGEFLNKYGASYVTLHRADLLQVLLTACQNNPQISIRYGHGVADVAHHANGVTLLVSQNNRLEEEQASALIGADGVWSQLRHLVHGAPKPEFSGLVAWRSLVPMDNLSAIFSRTSTGLWLGPDAHLVHYPLRGGSVMNVVAISPSSHTEKTAKGWLTPTNFKNRDKAFQNWSPAVKHLLQVPAKWGGWPIYSIRKAGPMTNGPLCLIGDAAHPMLPFAAQGGACAIEDAEVLAQECAASPDDLPKAFAQFQKQRLGRINKVLSLSRNNQRLYHMKPPLDVFRNIAMKVAPQRSLQKRMEWLYSWSAKD